MAKLTVREGLQGTAVAFGFLAFSASLGVGMGLLEDGIRKLKNQSKPVPTVEPATKAREVPLPKIDGWKK